MIDYLELLLDGQEQEEGLETEPLELGVSDPAVIWTGGGGSAAAPQAVGPGPAAVVNATKELAGAAGIPDRPIRVKSVSIRSAGKETDGNAGTARVTEDRDEAAAVENGGPRGENTAGTSSASSGAEAEPAEVKTGSAQSALWSALRQGQGGVLSAGGGFSLYRQMVQAGRAVGGLRQNARVLTVSENAAAAPTPGAAELDEIFARDARRYDSGFALY